jgi:AcrR family transcriptional regulator
MKEGAVSSTARQRKRPVQARSVARVERILDAAAAQIAEVGVASVTTTAIAQAAGITLASLYRYFPNKTAVIRAVAERQLQRLDAHFEAFLEDFDLEQGLERLLDTYAAFYRTEPGYVEIWSGVQAIPELAELDLMDLQRTTRRLAERTKVRYPSADEHQAQTVTMMLSRAISGVLRLAMTLPPDAAAAMLGELKVMARVYIRDRLTSGRREPTTVREEGEEAPRLLAPAQKREP